MGEIADMMLDGILDANGEYTGKNYGYPVYPKDWFKEKTVRSQFNEGKVRNFLIQRGITSTIKQEVLLFSFTKLPVNSKNRRKSFNEAALSWPAFRAFIDNKIGYIKPSKRCKEQN